MRALVVTGTYVPSAGGAEFSLYETLTYLALRGMEFRVLTMPSPRRKGDWAAQCVDIPPKDVYKHLSRQVERWQPDMIFTQLIWSEVVLETKSLLQIPVIYFARNTGSNLDLSPGRDCSPDLVVANSWDTGKVLEERWNCNCFVLHPVVLDSRFRWQRSAKRPSFLMVNSLTIKGGNTLKQIALLRPKTKFVTIYGWDALRANEAKDADWDPEMVQMLASARRKIIMEMPSFVQFDDVSNVKVLPVTDKIEVVLSNTRGVLVPSLWREALCRTVVEASACGVPSIVADVGGVLEGPVLPELILSSEVSPEEWAGKIDRLGNSIFWREASQSALDRYQKYRARSLSELDKFYDIMGDYVQ